MGWYGPWVAYIVDSSPKESVDFSLGLAMSVNQIAMITAPPFFGIKPRFYRQLFTNMADFNYCFLLFLIKK